MLPQEAMIERVRELCRADERLVAAMMYGSFTRGEGDEHSDVEFVLFFEDDALPWIDPREWVEQIAPVELYFVNEFGNHTAIFHNLVRGEFHFDKASVMGIVEGWKHTASLPSVESTLILDSTGELSRRLQTLIDQKPERGSRENVQFICDSFVNWTLFAAHVLARGEYARSHDLLSSVHRYLLWMARLLEDSTAHWPTPSKSLERDVSPEAYARYAQCTARLDPGDLRRAYLSAWGWGREMMVSLCEAYGADLNEGLLDRVGQQLKAAHPD